MQAGKDAVKFSDLFLRCARCHVSGIAAAAVLILPHIGCYTSHHRIPYAEDNEIQVKAPFETTPLFDYPKTEIEYSNHLAGRGASSAHELRHLEFPSIGANGQDGNLVTARYFRSTLPGSHPLVIVLPIWGSYTYPSRKISTYLQRHSDGALHVLAIQGEDYLVDWSGLASTPDESTYLELWRDGAEHQRVAMVDVRRLVDWAEQRSEIDSNRVALIGFSLGAIVAGTVATQEPRLAAVVIVMGGAHTHSIIAHCTGDRTSSIQQNAKLEFGWSQDDLEAQLEPIFIGLDPASYPGRVDPDRVRLIEANRDTCVPEASRIDLWEALGRPEKISLDYGHHKAFLSMTPLGLSWMRHRIWEFLDQRLLNRTRPRGR
jgi:dienelactone hydrolase